MRCAFALGTFRRALTAMAVILLATTTTIAQDNQQPKEGEEPSAQTEQAEEKEADKKEAEQKEAEQKEGDKKESEKKEPVVLKVIKFESMSVNEFLSAARLSGVIDHRATSRTPWQRSRIQQRTRGAQRPSDPQRLFVGTKSDSSMLFVRGPEKKVNKVEEFAKQLDVPPEERPETLQLENGKQAKRLPQEQIDDTKELLDSLGLETSTSKVGDTHYLVFEETEEAHVKQIEQVLERLSEGRDEGEKAEDAAAEETRKETEADTEQ